MWIEHSDLPELERIHLGDEVFGFIQVCLCEEENYFLKEDIPEAPIEPYKCVSPYNYEDDDYFYDGCPEEKGEIPQVDSILIMKSSVYSKDWVLELPWLTTFTIGDDCFSHIEVVVLEGDRYCDWAI